MVHWATVRRLRKPSSKWTKGRSCTNIQPGPLKWGRPVFITNNFSLPAATICALYKSRWQVELFFKWIKQHLRIKQFYGTSENAVKTQIWIAVSVYVLVAIVKKRLDLDASLYTLLQILSVTLFEKMPIHQALAGDENRCNASQITNQLNLFDLRLIPWLRERMMLRAFPLLEGPDKAPGCAVIS